MMDGVVLTSRIILYPGSWAIAFLGQIGLYFPKGIPLLVYFIVTNKLIYLFMKFCYDF